MNELEQQILEDRPKYDYNLCQLCLATGNDKRYLQVRCFYQIDEAVPEATRSEESGLYGLNICKDCRGLLLKALKDWREACISKRVFEKDMDGTPEPVPGANIPVRIDGRIQYMTDVEYDKWCQDNKPGA